MHKLLYELLLAALITGNILAGLSVADRVVGQLRISFYDVGQGDSYLITTPDNFSFLVDTGRGDIITQKLRRMLPPWRKLAGLFISHPDLDHIGNVEAVVRQFRPEFVVFAPAANNLHQEFEKLERVALEIKANIVRPRAGKRYKLGCCVELNLLWPDSVAQRSTKLSTNDLSLAMLLSYGRFNLLAAGDLSAEYEELISHYYQLTDVDVLKVGHHGSKTSSSQGFLDSIKPELAIIQVGKTNTYGHPNPDVLKNLAGVSAKVLRTDERGTIELASDGRERLVINSEK